jgi:hypothetical protein
VSRPALIEEFSRGPARDQQEISAEQRRRSERRAQQLRAKAEHDPDDLLERHGPMLEPDEVKMLASGCAKANRLPCIHAITSETGRAGGSELGGLRRLAEEIEAAHQRREREKLVDWNGGSTPAPVTAIALDAARTAFDHIEEEAFARASIRSRPQILARRPRYVPRRVRRDRSGNRLERGAGSSARAPLASGGFSTPRIVQQDRALARQVDAAAGFASRSGAPRSRTAPAGGGPCAHSHPRVA